MEFFDYSLKDLNRKIVGTIFLLGGSPWQFRHIYSREDVNSSNDVVEGCASVDGEWVLRRYPYSIMGKIRFYQPALGYVNHKGIAYYLVRTVSKQYMLGFNINNYLVGKGFDNDRRAAASQISYLHNGVQDPAFLGSVVNRYYTSRDEVVNKIQRGEILSGAVSSHIAINQSLHFDHPLISYKDKVVGYVDTRTNTNYLFNPAEYIERILPFSVTIQETPHDLTIRY